MSLLVPRTATDLIVVRRAHAEPITAAALDRLHRQQGMVAIAFHFLVNEAGEVEHGRPVDTIGSHTPGQNKTSIGVGLVGKSTLAQKAGLKSLLNELRTLFPGCRTERL